MWNQFKSSVVNQSWPESAKIIVCKTDLISQQCLQWCAVFSSSSSWVRIKRLAKTYFASAKI